MEVGTAGSESDTLERKCERLVGGAGEVCVDVTGTVSQAHDSNCRGNSSLVCYKFTTWGTGTADFQRVYVEWTDNHVGDTCSSAPVTVGRSWCATPVREEYLWHDPDDVCNTIQGMSRALSTLEEAEAELKVGPTC